MSKMKKYLLIASVCVVFVVCMLCFVVPRVLRVIGPSYITERPATATDLPEYDGEVTDVRITSIPRTMEVFESGSEYIQILYGYEIDGQWTDIPMENYPFYCLEDGGTQCPFGDTLYSHIVKIDSFVLICITTPYGLQAPYDSIGTEPLEPFREFAEKENASGGNTYGILTEDRTKASSWFKVGYSSMSFSRNRHYFILDLESLPEDYELHYVEQITNFLDPERNREEQCVLTVQDIWNYVAQIGENVS